MALQQETERLRAEMARRAGDRDRELDGIEAQLGRRVAAVQTELTEARKINDSLEKELGAARDLAARQSHELTAERRRSLEREAELARERQVAAVRESELAKVREKAAARAAELAKERERAAVREAELARARQAAARDVAAEQAARSAAEQKLAALAKARDEAEAKATELREAQAQASAAAAEAERQRSKLLEREVELVRERQRAAQSEAEVVRLRKLAEAKEQELQRQQTSVARQEQELQRQRAAVLERERELEQARLTAASRERELAEQRVAAGQQTRELEQERKAAAAREEELRRQREAAATASNRALRIEGLLAQREQELQRIRDELDKREQILRAEAAAAKLRAQQARDAGRKEEAAQAGADAARLADERAEIGRRLQAQDAAVRDAQDEARRNAEARASAEAEAARLRKELGSRAAELQRLSRSGAVSASHRHELALAERRVAETKARLEQQLAEREARLRAVEGELGARLSATRKELQQAQAASAALQRDLAAARDREQVAQTRAEQAERSAAKVGALLEARERDLVVARDQLAAQEREVERRLTTARAAERDALAAGLAQEAEQAAAKRSALEGALGQLRGDLDHSRSELEGARNEAKRHQEAARAEQARAAELARSLAEREVELEQLRKRPSGRNSSAEAGLQAAEQRVAAARAEVERAAAERGAWQQKQAQELERRVAEVRRQEEERAAAREADLRRTFDAERKAADRDSEAKTARVAALLDERSQQLEALKVKAEQRMEALRAQLRETERRAKAASVAGRRAEADTMHRELGAIRSGLAGARTELVERDKEIATARGEAKAEASRRAAAERRAQELRAALDARAAELAALRADRRSDDHRVEAAAKALAESQRKLAIEAKQRDDELRRENERLQRAIEETKASAQREYAMREAALTQAHTARETALRSALVVEQQKREAAESAARRGDVTVGVDDFVRKQQTRIAILEARAERERGARERERAEADVERDRAARLAAELDQERRQRPAVTDNEVQRRAEAMAAKMVEERRAQEEALEAERRAEAEKAQIRQQAALERMRSRGGPAAGEAKDGRARILDVQITAEGRARGQVNLPIDGAPRYEVLSRTEQRLALRILDATLPEHLQRIYDTRSLDGPIERVTVFVPSNQPQEARIVVDLVARASSAVSLREGRLIWDFVRTDAPQGSSTAASGQRVWVGGDGRARAPQPLMAPEGEEAAAAGGGSGAAASSAEAAGVNSNPVKSPWRSSRRYTGKRINLTIKDADIRHVLTFLAKEGNVNIIAGPEVAGSITFHLENIPWDLALDVILRARGLDYVRQSGVIRVSTMDTLKKEFDLEVERRQKLEDIKQLVVRIIPVNYGSSTQLIAQARELLSKKGTVSTDERTNALIVKDTEEHVAAVEEMVRKLDAQTPQVLVEARIVEASSNFTKDVGIQWGGNSAASSVYGNETGLAFPSVVGVAGGADGGQANIGGVAITTPNYAVNMPAAVGQGSGGAIGLTLGSLGGAHNLNVRLSAAETEGTVKIVSSPKVMTLDNKTAQIRQGISIPISVVSAQGVQTRFFNADLQLQATPHITQDGNILMKLNISKNEPDFSNRAADGNPTITQREAQTELLLGDGETTVIGGIYTRSTSESIKKVPLLGDLPLIGGLFRTRSEQDKRTELLIFITPRIVNRSASITVGR